MKKLIAAGVIAAASFGVFASANAFAVNDQVFASGDALVNSCTESASVDLTSRFNEAMGQYVVEYAHVNTNSAACNGLVATVQLTQNDGERLGTQNSDSINNNKAQVLFLGQELLVEDVTDVHVVIDNAPVTAYDSGL